MSPRKLCVVTGSSSGIGAATARLYASRGWDVVVNFSRDPTPAEAVAAECRALGAAFDTQALVVKADIASDADCCRLAEAVRERFGRADVLVNNAGTTKFVPLKDLDGLQAADFHAIYAVNVVGSFQMTRALVPLLRAQAGAAVVNVSSVAGSMGRGSSIAYMASKGAINAMTAGLARALGPGIRVNAIAPGMVETSWLKSGLGDSYDRTERAYKKVAALEAVVSPEEVAETAWYLGAAATKTTGEILLIDAGWKLTKA